MIKLTSEDFSMASSQNINFPASAYVYPIFLVLLIWIVFWAEQSFGINFRSWGIRPRSLIGLRGIIFSPFLHGSTSHLLSNSLPLLVLSMVLLYFYRGISFQVLIVGGLLTGFFTWLIGRGGSVHIGASGIIYLMAGFLFFKGIWSRNARLIAVSLVVVFLYGSLIWGVFPMKEKVSWEGHLSGLVSGILCALYYKNYKLPIETTTTVKKPVSLKEAEFLSHFDENGNFVPASEWRRRNNPQDSSMDVEINYKYKSSDQEK